MPFEGDHHATAVAPRFRQSDFAGGIDAGIDAML